MTGVIEDARPPLRRTGSHRRRRVTPQQKAMVVVIALAGVALAITSPGEPTGQVSIDAAYRAVFVFGLALAASRARRWALIVSSAVASAAALGLGLLFGGVALLMAVFLVGKDFRSRVYGALIGALIGLSLLRSSIGWFLGASLLIGVMATIPVVLSAYNVSRPSSKKLVRRLLLVGLGIGALCVGAAAYQVVAYVSPLRSAVSTTAEGIDLVESGSTLDAATRFAEASSSYASVADRSEQIWFRPARLVPVVSQNLHAISTVSRAGASLTAAAERTTTDVDYDEIRQEGGGVDLALLGRFRAPVDDAYRQLTDAAGIVDDIESPWILGPLDSRIEEFDRRVNDLLVPTELAQAALEYGPTMFGANGERRYLVLLGNPAELRDLGGHIGNWAELSVNDGRISLVDVGQPLELTQPRLDSVLDERGGIPPSVLALRPGTFPQNWGASIDFPVSADVAARLYASKVGRRMDGVFYADPYALAAMLNITGPVPIPSTNGEISSANAVEFLTLDQFRVFEDPNDGNEALTELVEDLFEEFTSSTLPTPKQLGDLFGPLVKQGRFRLVSTHPEDHRLLELTGLDNGFRPTPGEDLLGLINRNANPSKIDTFLRRTASYDVQWDPESGLIDASVTVTLENQAPATGFAEYVLGNSAGLPTGTNITDLAVISPFEAYQVTVDGRDAAFRPLRDIDVWRHSVRVEIPPGQTRTVVFELEGDVEPGDEYRLRFSGQPLVESKTATVRVTASDREIVEGDGIEVAGSVATATLSDVGQTILTLRAK